MLKKKIAKKKYVPNSKEKYMCARHKKYFTEELINWKKDIIKANNLGNILNSSEKYFLCLEHIYFSLELGIYFFLTVFFLSILEFEGVYG